MKLTKLNSTKKISVPVNSNIDWDKKVASKPQFLVKSFLKKYWLHDPVIEEFFIPGSKLRIDFFNPRLKIAVEVSPDKVHVFYNPWMHKDRFGFMSKVNKDEDKRKWCQANEIRLVELYDEDIKNLSWELFNDKYDISL